MIHSYLVMKVKARLMIVVFLLGISFYCFGEKIVIQAQKKEFIDDIFKAEGDVEVIWGDYHIFAQYVEYNKKTGIVIARGRVTMSSKDSIISGEELTFNTKDKTGEIIDAYGMMKPTIRYETDHLKQIDDDTLTFDKMDFTSCSQLKPRWKITCKEGKIKKEKYVEMKHAVFWIKKIPFFYIPYIKYPVDKDGRATGFLFPNFGYSDLRGYYILNDFFWELNSNLDLTIGLDYYSQVGLGIHEELRYLYRNMSGFVKFYYFNYSEDSVFQTDSEYDYYIKAEHLQNINFLNTKVIFKVNYPSDPNFLRQFNNNFDTILSTNFNSSFALTSSFSIFNLSISASRYETYILQEEVNDSDEVELVGSSKYNLTLPSISLNIKQKKIGKIPGYFSLNSTYESTERGGLVLEGEPEFDSDERSNRFIVIPQYTLSLVKLPWLNASVTLDSRNSFYGRSKDPETEEVVDVPLRISYQEAKVVLKGPIFYKIYDSKKKKTKHLIEPQVTFRYATSIPEEDRERMLMVDLKDYPSYSYVGFGLTSRLITKDRAGNESPREILSFSLSQEYYLDPEEANHNKTINDIYPEFSDLRASLRFKPFKNFSLNVNVSYNYFIEDFTRINAKIAYDNENSVVNGYFSYSKTRNAYTAADYFFNREVIRALVNLNVKGFPLKLSSDINYDITEKEFRSASIKAILDYQCVIINAEFKIFSYWGREETQFNIGVSFGNLGMASNFFGEGE